ncbi:MAG: hypothetical protein QM704_08620 [Anaeromyxobacteraceae bacterium]
MRCWRVVAVSAGLWLAAPAYVLGQAGTPGPIAAENALPGDGGWRLVQRAGPGQLEAYSDAPSAPRGGSFGIHARADAPHAVRWALFRMGWYGGVRGRRVAEGGPVAVGPQATPIPDPATGRSACAWPETFRLATSPSWPSGVFLLVLTRDDGAQTYVPLVLRDDARKGVAVLQVSVNTWQAYNWWGSGSLYTPGVYAVSFDRPYADANGAGQYFRVEHDLVAWVEKRGLDVTYLTNVDLDRDASLLAGQKLFVSMGHDEYWTRPARAALEAAIAAGTSVAFLSANSIYWQVRLEPGVAPAGGVAAPARTLVCYKDTATRLDPLRGTNLTTVRWRQAPVSEPENALLGSMYSAWILADTAWVVTNAGHWLYAGTGLADGDAIPGVVGYETDRRFSNGVEPPGVEVVARAAVADVEGRPEWHEAVVRATPAGGYVFAAGSIELAWALARTGYADPRMQRMAENLFRRAGVVPETPDSPAARPDPLVLSAAADAVVTTVAGAAFEEGLVDGPAAAARFRRPTAAAVDALGRVWITDTGNHAVRLVLADAGRTVQTVAGDGVRGCGTGTSARLDAPQGIVIDADGSALVADTGNHRIVRIRDLGGRFEVERVAGGDGWNGFADGPADDARFFGPSGLARAGGALFVADRENHAVRRLDAAGLVTTVAGKGYEPGLADGPAGTSRLNLPSDLAVVGDGLLVLDAGNRRLRRLALDGLVLSSAAGANDGGFADGAADAALLMGNAGLSALAGGAGLAFADGGNARIRLLREGMVETLAGDGTPGARDGAAAGARFALPTGVATLSASEWLVVDNGASTLRRIAGASAPPPPPPPPAAKGPRAGGGGCQSGGAGVLGLALAGLAWLAQARGRRRAGRSAITAP